MTKKYNKLETSSWYVIYYWYQKAGNLRFKTAIKHKQHAID